ncbi:5-oxoprolinase subunit PxpB [Planosporangium thailandense]|uniref:5-oxoprolinase subunit PxpB n=1 Tax=Planosporangium thailandense TaxID=765197 RepID=UPI001F0E6496|nr:5-oxoprolinase subunit PxpB [Planosporangium thailandense]
MLTIKPAGDRAMLVELADLDQVTSLYQALLHRSPAGVRELVPAARTVLVAYDPEVTTFDRLTRSIREYRIGETAAVTGPLVEIPVRYDGADLDAVAELTGLGRTEIIRRHTTPEYVVAFCGFAPGFGYLTGVDPLLRLPRHSSPRTRVPAGSVAVAGEFTAVYPRESPGGWQLLGRTDLVMWDVERNPPALLAPGTRVRFVEVPE